MKAELKHLNGCFVRLNRKGRGMTYQKYIELCNYEDDREDMYDSNFNREG
jgi:hypothetical protein